MSRLRFGLILVASAVLLGGPLAKPARAQSPDRRPVVTQVYVNGPALILTGDSRGDAHVDPRAGDAFWGAAPRAERDRSRRPAPSYGHAPHPAIAPCRRPVTVISATHPGPVGYEPPWPPRSASWHAEEPSDPYVADDTAAGYRPVALLPTIAASSERTYGELEVALDPVVDPILDGAVQSAGALAGVAIGVALYPTVKVLERVAGDY